MVAANMIQTLGLYSYLLPIIHFGLHDIVPLRWWPTLWSWASSSSAPTWMCVYIYIYIYTYSVCVYIYIYIYTHICVICVCIYIYIYIWGFMDTCMTTQHIALTPREKHLRHLFPLGVVVRFRAAFAEHITLRPYGQQLLKLFCSWDGNNLEHTLSSYFG